MQLAIVMCSWELVAKYWLWLGLYDPQNLLATKCGFFYTIRGKKTANGRWMCDVQVFHAVAVPSLELSTWHTQRSHCHAHTHTSAQHTSRTFQKGFVLTHTACTLSSLHVYAHNTVILTSSDLIFCAWRCLMSSLWLYTHIHTHALKSHNFSFITGSFLSTIVKITFTDTDSHNAMLLRACAKLSHLLIWAKPEHYTPCGCCKLYHLLMKVNLIHNSIITAPHHTVCVCTCLSFPL